MKYCEAEIIKDGVRSPCGLPTGCTLALSNSDPIDLCATHLKKAQSGASTRRFKADT